MYFCPGSKRTRSCLLLQLESSGDFVLYHDRVLGVNYNQCVKFVDCTRNSFSFSEEPAKKGENENYKRSTTGINS